MMPDAGGGADLPSAAVAGTVSDPAPARRHGAGYAFAAVGLGFVVLAVLAHRVPYFPLDLDITRSVQQIQVGWVIAALNGLSTVGFPPLVDVIYGTISLAIFAAGRRREAVGAGIAAAGGAALNFAIKAMVARPRPPTELVHVQHLIPNPTFPAGHVLNATAFFGFLCYLAHARMAPSWRRTGVIALLVLVMGGMGLARIYSGEHWPSDVLGGYLLGWMWMSVAIVCYRRLERRAGPADTGPGTSSAPTHVRSRAL